MVSIITVNYNETTTTCALLDSIRRQDYRDVEVIVVDNASRENPASIIQAQYPEVKFIRSEQNLGFAGGNNLALPHAHGEHLFYVNNDAEIEPGCIEKLLQLFENHSNVGIASPLICYFPEVDTPAYGKATAPAYAKATAGKKATAVENATPGKPYTVQYAGMTPISPFTGRNHTIGERVPDQGQFTEPSQTAYAHGAAMMVPRKILEKVGPMWEGFFLYYEELDWCERIRRAGYEVWVEPRARVWHKESLTLDKMGAAKTYYLTHNRILFMRRNFGGWRLAVFFVFLFFVTVPKNGLFYLLNGEIENLKAFLRGVFSSFKSTTNFPKVLNFREVPDAP